MIITLKGADFSNSNVGTLDTWLITKSLKGVTTTSTVTSVDKGGSYTATFKVTDGYELYSEYITMGGVDIGNNLVWNTDGTEATLTISKVTGNVYINIVATSISGEDSGIADGKIYLDLSGITWTQGHYDANGNATGTSNSMYEYRIGSNVIEIPEAARGKKLYFELNDDFEINFRSGTGSNPYRDNYYYISYAATSEDSGVNGSCRGYAVQLASDATHMRLMMSHDDASASSVNNMTTKITPSEAVNAGLKIYYKTSDSIDIGGTLDLSSLVWTQGHYDSNCVDTGTDSTYYNYRVRSNILDVSAIAGKTLHFDMGDDYRINLRAGSASDWNFNYYYVNPNATSADSGVNSGSRGYEVTLPSTVTRMRMMMSFIGSSDTDVANTTKTITPVQANASNLIITIK